MSDAHVAGGARRPEYGSLRRGLEILTLLQGSGRLRMADIGERLGLPLSTTYRYVGVLRDAGYLVEVDGYLVPSDRLADSNDGSRHLVESSAQVLHWMRNESSLTAVMTVRVRTAALCLDVALAHPRHRIAFQRGQVHSLHAGASVLPLLAFAPARVIREVTGSGARRYTSATPGIGTLEAEIAQVRTDGYAMTMGHVTPGMAAMGVPVLADGRCVCALSLVGDVPAVADTDRVLATLQEGSRRVLERMTPSGEPGAWLAPKE